MTHAHSITPAARDSELAMMRAMLRGFQLAVMLREAAELGLADRVAAGPRGHPGAGDGSRHPPWRSASPLPCARRLRRLFSRRRGAASR